MALLRVGPYPWGMSDYAGEISFEAAWELLKARPDAVLVDVRSQAEWDFVGMPQLAELDKDVVGIQWATYPGMEPNPAFLDQVKTKVPDPDAPILFLCRSGARSLGAARMLTAAGYTAAYNVTGGFEGDMSADGHRHGGWKDELPWRQS